MAELIKKEKLLFGLPIDLKEFGTIYQPRLYDFLEFDYTNFKTVFSIKKETLSFLDENMEGYDELEDFDFIFMLNLSGTLCKALSLLYKTDNIKIDYKYNNIESAKIIINTNNETYCIDRKSYTKFADLILIMLHEGNNIKNEEVKKDLDEVELEILKRKKAFEKKKAQREAELRKQSNEEPTTIFDMANYIIHNDNKYDYESVLNLTVYQLINSFKLYNLKENYQHFMDCKTSGNFKIENDIAHWFFGK